MRRANIARALALAQARVRSFSGALQLTAVLQDGAVGPENHGVEPPLEVLDREVDSRCKGVNGHGDKLGPVVNGTAEQARGVHESEGAQRNGK